MSPLLEVRDLSVRYASRRRTQNPLALDKVALTIAKGETLGLVGESGSGKSTIGNVVLGLVRPLSGSVIFEGEDITRLSASRRRPLATRIQAVFQDPYSSFNPNRTVGQAVSETLSTVDQLNRSEVHRRVTNMLERVGLPGDAAHRFPSEFSGGQRQRIAIARALIVKPRLVVCDESVSALDLSVQAQVLNLLADLQQETGVAYLFITHDLSVVRHVSHRVVVLHHGRVVEEGTNHEVIDAPKQPYSQALLAAAPVPNPDVQAIRRESRRAIKALDASVAHGLSNAASPGTEWTTLEALTGLRRSFERRAAFEAARAKDAASIQALRQAVRDMDQANTAEAFAEADRRFHRALFAAVNAPDLVHLPPIVAAAVEQTLTAGNALKAADRRQLTDLHRQILLKIEDGDDRGVLLVVDEHFNWLDGALQSEASV